MRIPFPLGLAISGVLGLAAGLAMVSCSKADDVASIFAEPQPLACGGRNNRHALGVAHKTLPCGTRVVLTYNGRTVEAKVMDRGPYIKGRTWDLMVATASALGRSDGVFRVSAKVLP